MKCFPRLLACVFGISAARAEYYNFSDGKSVEGADILYQETRYPQWPEHTYNARWFPGIAGGKTKTSFYSGPAWSGNADTGTREIGYIWSFWGVDKPVKPGDSVIPVWWNGRMADAPSIGEGASGKVEGSWTMSTGVWYPSVVRIWGKPGGAADESFCGQWFKDGATGQWHHLATFRLPFTAERFVSDTGFIEDPSTGNRNPRRVDFRNYYMRRSGKWEAANIFTPSTRQATEKGTSGLIENDTAAFFETCSGPDYKGNMGPGAQKAELRLKTPETPVFDKPVIAQGGALATGNRTVVKWRVAEKSSPQFSWKAELLDAGGAVLASRGEIKPDADQVLLVSDKAAISARVTMTDVFDQSSAPFVVSVMEEKAAPARKADVSAAGLAYEYYEGDWKKLPTFDAAMGPPVQSGAVNGPDISIRRKNAGFACRYRGFIRIPTPGLWSFSLRSSDGSSLSIGGNEVIGNDGMHSAGYETSGVASLAAGLHEIDLRYFKSTARGGEECVLALSWEGPGTPLQMVPDGAWGRTPAAGEPVVKLISPALGSLRAGGNVFSATVKGADDARLVRFYQNQTVAAASFIPEDKGGYAVFSASELAGAGKENYRARLVYGPAASRTIDSAAVSADLQQAAVAPWEFSSIGRHFFPTASSVEGTTHTFVGDGLNFNWRKVSGDTTIIAEIAKRPSNTWVSQADGSEPDGWWSGGVIFRDDLHANPGSEIGRKFVALFASARNSIHVQDHTNHNAGGLFWGKNQQNPKGSFRWLKLRREGQIFRSYASADGVEWVELETRDHSAKPLPAEMYVGVYTLARPGTNTNPPRWKFANVTLGEQVAAPALPPAKVTDLAASWPMDEKSGAGVRDVSGNGLDGMLSISAVRVPGVKGNAVALDGKGAEVSFPPLALATNRVTICGWVKREGAQTPWSGIAMCRGGGATGLMFGPGNELRFNWDFGRNSSYNFASRLVPPDGKWAFVALAVDPASATLHMVVDGRAEKTICKGVFDPASFDGDFRLGSDPHSDDRKLKGALDEFRVFRRTLDEEEIAKLARSR